MYDIITLEPEDPVVQIAYDVIIGGKAGILPNPDGHFVFSTPTESLQEGDGGRRDILVIVGHGSSKTLSGMKDWSAYKQEFLDSNIAWHSKTAVYVVACSTAGEGDKFLHGNFAWTVKQGFPDATVWASSSVVSAKNLTGTWEKIG